MRDFFQAFFLIIHIASLVSVRSIKVFRVEDEGCAILISKYHDSVRYFPDNGTLQFFGFRYEDLRPILSATIKDLDLRVDDPIPRIDPSTIRNNDDFDAAYNCKIRILQDDDSLIGDLNGIGDVLNPAVVFFKGRYLSVARPTMTDPLVFAWLQRCPDTGRLSIDDKSEFLGIGPGYTHLQSQIVQGEDPRLLVMGDSLLVVTTYYQSFSKFSDENKMHITCLKLEDSRRVLTTVNDTTLKSEVRYEKNWSPFIYRGQLMFIYALEDQFVVIQQQSEDPSSVKIVSATSSKHLQWDFGGIRGGTPGRLIGE
jgi:hypothetical protein